MCRLIYEEKGLYIHGAKRPSVNHNQIDDRGLHLADPRALDGSLWSSSLRYQ